MRRNTALTLILSLLCLVGAQADNYKLLPSEQLTNNQVNCIMQDVRGFIWLGTDNGLNRYDGQTVTQYVRVYGDPESLSNNTVRCITPCNDGSLWVGLANGMQRFCPRDDNFHNIEFPRDIRPNVTHIVNRRSGKDVVIGTSGYGLMLMPNDHSYKAREWEEVNEVVPCRYITHIMEDSRGRLWVASGDNSCYVYDPATNNAWRALPEDATSEVNYICEEHSGRILVVTHSAVFACSRTDSVCHSECFAGEGRDIVSASHDAAGQLLVVLRHEGMMRYDRTTNTLVPYKPLGSSADRLMRTLNCTYTDSDGNLWMTSATMGVAMTTTSGQTFAHWRREDYDEAMDGAPRTMIINNDGGVTTFYDNGAIATFTTDGTCTSHSTMPRPVYSVCKDHEGRMWMGYFYGGVACMNADGNIVQNTTEDTDQLVNGIDVDADGMVWYATFGSGFRCLNPNTGEVSKFRSDNAAVGLRNNWINHLQCDNKGRVWLGHCEGLDCYDPAEGQCLKMKEVDELPFTFCYCICVANDGTVWAGTDNGVVAINTDLHVVGHYTTAEGLCHDIVSAIVEDSNGNMWVSTARGLSRIAPKGDPKVERYYAGDGLVDRQYIPRAVACDVTGGRIYFGGTRGITSFCSMQLDNKRPVPDVRLMALIINNQPASARTMSDGNQVMTVAVTEADEFRLGYEDNSFTMEFGVTRFASTDDIAYEYSFDGNHWETTPQGQNRITFTHLSAGKYKLHVRAQLGRGVSEAKIYTIYISAPWYASLWAMILYTVLFFALIGAIMFVYLRNKRAELNESKLVFFTNISHEIRTPMTMIVSPLDKLIKDPTLGYETHRSLVTMRQNAGRILTLMNQLLDIRKFDKGQMTLSCRRTDMVGFLDGIARLFDEQARGRGITFSYERPDEPVEAWIDQSHIDKVVMNLLSNAFKFTPDGGTITMRLTTDDKHLTVAVTDTGIGLDPKDKERIFQRFYRSSAADAQLGTGIGLHLSSQLMRLHHGTLAGDNRGDGQRGSIFSFTLPLGKNYLTADELAPESPVREELKPLPATTEVATPVDADEEQAARQAKGGVRVMIVDDDEEILSYLKNELQCHYRLLLCRNGQEALTIALREQPAVIVSDVMMPEMDGCTMVKRLRSNANISHIPVILLSAKTEVEDRVAGLSQGADAYLAKPFHTDELLALIHTLIEGRQRLRGVYSGSRDQEARVEDIEMQSSDEQLMERLMKVVNQHLSDSEFNIEQLTSEVGLSRTHLHRKLKAMTGLSASEFLRNLRMRQAEQLLKSKRMNISQIAYAVGFANQTHFSTAFKKHTGMSPSEYIEANAPK